MESLYKKYRLLVNWLKDQKAKRVIKEQQKANQKIQIYKSCDFLPAWRFFEILKTTDYRYLLIIDNFLIKTIEYDQSLLAPVWDEILNEYDRLNGDYFFTSTNDDLISDIEEINHINILKACYCLMLLGQDKALKELAELGIKIDKISYESVIRLRSIILNLQTKIQIREASISDDKKEDNTFIDAVTRLSNIFKRQIDKDRITVSEWIVLNKQVKELNKTNHVGID